MFIHNPSVLDTAIMGVLTKSKSRTPNQTDFLLSCYRSFYRMIKNAKFKSKF